MSKVSANGLKMRYQSKKKSAKSYLLLKANTYFASQNILLSRLS
jgi:hypothetical protein